MKYFCLQSHVFFMILLKAKFLRRRESWSFAVREESWRYAVICGSLRIIVEFWRKPMRIECFREVVTKRIQVDTEAKNSREPARVAASFRVYERR